MKATLVLLASLFVLVHPAGAATAPEREPDPSRLWSEFPLVPVPEKRPAPARIKTPRASPPPPAPVAARPERATVSPLLVALITGAAAALTLVIVVTRSFVLGHFRPIAVNMKGVPSVTSFIRRHSDDQSDNKRPPAETVDDVPARPLGEAVTSYTMHQPGAEPAPEDEPHGVPLAQGVSYDELGQRIANVLRAAEENAAALLAAARAEAQAFRETAEREAREVRSQLDTETAEQRAESERVRAEANKYAEDRRRGAEQEVEHARSEAEAEARSLREAGEAIKRQLEEKGAARRQELLEASASIESRLHYARTTCLDVAAEIEQLLGDEPADDLEEALFAEVQEADALFAKVPEEDEQSVA